MDHQRMMKSVMWSLPQIPHQRAPEISVGVFSSQPLLTTTARLISFLCMTGTVSETWCHWDMEDLQWKHEWSNAIHFTA